MYRHVIALCVLFSSFSLPAPGAAIGVARTTGTLRIDNQMVVSNATVFDGSMLETASASSDLDLAGGVRLRIGASSRARVFGDRLVLEKGLGELARGGAYRVEALGLRVAPETSDSSGRVALVDSGKVQALALEGSLRVSTADGTVVAFLAPGRALEFQPQAVTGAEVPFEMTGCLQRREGRFVLRDPLTGVVEEVRGERLEGEVGRMLEVTATAVPGAKPVTGALEVIQIRRMRRVSGTCLDTEPAAAKPAAETAKPTAEPAAGQTAPARPAAAPSQAPTVSKGGGSKAVIGGVIVGGAAAGAVIYWKTQQKDETGTISR
jgi:hypothetical protein